jgi:hypothetical protein
MPSDGTIGGLVGKLDVLRIECPTCGRQPRTIDSNEVEFVLRWAKLIRLAR